MLASRRICIWPTVRRGMRFPIPRATKNAEHAINDRNSLNGDCVNLGQHPGGLSYKFVDGTADPTGFCPSDEISS